MNPLFLLLVLLLGCSKDPYQWLEKIEGPKALNWVKEQNQQTFAHFEKNENYQQFLNTTEEILSANDRIPYGSFRGEYIYNFWQDKKNIRGIIRRTTLNDYYLSSPSWEVVLDLDKLAEKEKENWVYKRTTWFAPYNGKCLLHLSRGGKDAVVIREFDAEQKQFVANGFYLEEAKSDVAWFDQDTLLVGTNWGPEGITSSGYPRIVKKWKRGTPVQQAKELFAGETEDVSVSAHRDLRVKDGLTIISRNKSFYFSQNWILDEKDNLQKLSIPEDAEFFPFKERFIILIKSDWKLSYREKVRIFPRGALLAAKISDINKLDLVNHIEEILIPDSKMNINDVQASKNYLIVDALENVMGKIIRYELKDNKWNARPLPLPPNGATNIIFCDPYSDKVFIEYENSLEPSSLYLYWPHSNGIKLVKRYPEKFDSSKFKTEQHEAISKDGTRIPYFIVAPKELQLTGKNPTLLYGYGGFQHAMRPYYSVTIGKLWLEQGGVYVLSNIRGGGEFGPRWHQAALKKNRHKSFEDFIAIAEDLVNKKITSPRHLGIMGGSNGGLLMGAVLTQRPELFNAVVCQVPLLDMLRYHKLLAGASWIGEYGDPEDTNMREYLLNYSPYHNVQKDKKYPEVLIMTSTKDDRVHPGHARKMVAKMKDQGHSVYYYENVEGGHGGAANLRQRATWYALEFSYLWEKLK